MKVWILAGAISALAVPAASASTTDCEADDPRRPAAQQRNDATADQPPAERATLVERAAPTVRAEPARRRSGKHIPDAELIGVRGAL